MAKVLQIAKQKFLVLICLILTMSYAVQIDIVEINATGIEKLVDITTGANFGEVLPNNGYVQNVAITWAVPDSTLENIDEEEVFVYVDVKPMQNYTGLSFQRENSTYEKLYLVLRCVVVNGQCAEGSVLQNNFTIRLMILDNETLNNAVLITASTYPDSSNEVYVEKLTLEAGIAELEKNISEQVLGSEQFSDITELLDSAKEDLTMLDIEGAEEKVSKVTEIIRLTTVQEDVISNMPMEYILLLIGDLTLPLVVFLIACILCISYVFLKQKKKPNKRRGST
jgi:hypothetical protein